MADVLKNAHTHLFLVFLFLGILPLSSCSEKPPETPFIIGMPYQEARDVIMKSGWMPAHADRTEMDAEYRLPHFYYDAEYTEVMACSGAGMGYCAFKFHNEKGEYLRVTTQGGDYDPDDTSRPIVTYVGLSDDFG